jgi:NTP pyrophosphatase (non-canonical NTP hydrolase)
MGIGEVTFDEIEERMRMEAMTGKISLEEFANINWHRATQWHEGTHDWSLADWATALGGECGEALNIVKKIRRIETGVPPEKRTAGDLTLLKAKLAQELADTYIYMDLLATAAGIRLDRAITETFNAKSEEYGFPHRMEYE